MGPDGALDLRAIGPLMRFFAEQGAHGTLLSGTTGEGTSLSDEERLALFGEALKVRERHPDWRILAATGTPSLTQSIALSREAFALGCDAVLVLPPYHLRNVSEEGLFRWYAELIEAAVPESGPLLAYHIPQITGIDLSLKLLQRLSQAFPRRFAGIKDSSSDLQHAKEAIEALPGKAILVGNDHLIGPSLAAGSAGAITALGNLCVAASRRIWDQFEAGEDFEAEQIALSRNRNVLDANPSAPAFLKALMPRLEKFPQWTVRPPLLPFDDEKTEQALQDFNESLDG